MCREMIIQYIKKHPNIYRITIEFLNKANRAKRRHLIIRKLAKTVQRKEMLRLKTSSVLKYQRRREHLIRVLDDQQDRDVFIPANLPTRTHAQIEKVTSPAIYCTELSDVLVIGGSNVIISEDYYMNDKFDLPYSNEFEFATGPVFECHDGICCVEVDKEPKTIKRGVYLLGEASNNYYHWIFDILSKILYLNRLEEYADVPLLIDETVSRHPTCLKMLEYVDRYNHQIRIINSRKAVLVESMVYISPTTWSSVYQSQRCKTHALGRYVKPQFVIDEYQRLVLPMVESSNSSLPKRIFIYRGSNKYKRLVNEDELCRIATKYGFLPYDPGASPMLEQVRVFSNADFIIAASGAALVNLMWCQSVCRVICISPIEWNDYNYSTLAYLVGAECTYLDGELVDETRHYVDSGLFEETLNAMLNA